MRTYNVVDKTYVKSNNSTNKIISRYTYSLLAFIILSSIINLFLGNKDIIILLIKTIIISLVISSIIAYIINIIKKKYNFIKIYTEDNTIFISLVISLFGYNSNIYILLISIFISFIIKNIYKEINNSCVIYGIILLIISNYFNNINDLFNMTNNYNVPYTTLKDIGIINYLFNIKYLVPALSILSFIYLFYKKGIKYSLLFSYIGLFIFMMLLIGMLNGKIYLVLFELLTSNILFIGVYLLSDYKISPTIDRGGTIYGIILGYLTVILRFIIPQLAILLPIALSTFIINKPLDKISYKFKYNEKLYYLTLTISLVIVLITCIII